MAKAYVNTVKYVIHTSFEVNGIVDKPDIVGAVFGQSEGLLGDELDLKELQKNGKVGRIEVDLKSSLGKTKGDLHAPSSMDMVETSLLAAAIEAVDKVGPCEAKFSTVNIEDTRGEKRKEIKDRAKTLLQKMMAEQIPESQEITEEVRDTVKVEELVEIGTDKLPAGPEAESSKEIVVVEGRADVINMLRAAVKNVIGMEGSKISETIVNICKNKTVTIFVDGDRGGDLIARKLMQLAKVDFIAKAPDGKEVEELARKEILQSLHRKIPATEYRFSDEGFVPSAQQGHSAEYPPVQSYDRGPREEHRGYGRGRSEGGYSSGRSEGSYGRGRSEGRSEGSYGRGRSEGRSEGSYGRGRSEGSKSEGGYSSGRSEGSHGRGRSEGRRSEGGYSSGRSEGSYGRGRSEGGSYGRGRSEGRSEGSYGRGRSEGGYGRPSRGGYGRGRPDSGFSSMSSEPFAPRELPPSAEEQQKFTPLVQGVKGTLKAKLFDAGMNMLKEVDVKELVKVLPNEQNVKVVVFDGIITKRLAEAADKLGIDYVVGLKKGKVEAPKKTKLLAMDG